MISSCNKLLSLHDVAVRKVLNMLNINDVLHLDTAYCNHSDRARLLEVLSSLILDNVVFDTSEVYIDKALTWVGRREIDVIDLTIKSETEYDGDALTNTGLIGLSNRCSKLRLLSITHEVKSSIKEAAFTELIRRCINLESLDIHGKSITDKSILAVANNCNTNLQSLNVSLCTKISDVGITIIAERCRNLKHLNLWRCANITNNSIIKVATNCTQLLSLKVCNIPKITDASIIKVATNCTQLLLLNVTHVPKITDASIYAISENCTSLTALDAMACYLITGSNIHNLIYLNTLNLGWCNSITSANVIKIAKC